MSSPGKRPPACPAGVGLSGRRLWKRLTKGYEYRPDELVLLDMAARTADTIAELEAAMVNQPLTSKGSMGQTRENPLLSELRQQRAALARLMNQLKLPEAGAGPAVNHGRAMANQRWARRSQPAG